MASCAPAVLGFDSEWLLFTELGSAFDQSCTLQFLLMLQFTVEAATALRSFIVKSMFVIGTTSTAKGE